MKKLLLVLSIVFVALLSSCSNDSNDNVTPQEPEGPAAVLPAVTTLQPLINTQRIRFRGNITSEGDNGYYQRGVCWGNNTNPLKGSYNYVIADGSGTGEYFADYGLLLGDFTRGETYNIRAFIIDNNGGVIYGNNLSMTLP